MVTFFNFWFYAFELGSFVIPFHLMAVFGTKTSIFLFFQKNIHTTQIVFGYLGNKKAKSVLYQLNINEMKS